MANKKPAEERASCRAHRIPEEARVHLKAAGSEIRKSLESLLPPEFVRHGRAARREMLLAARSLIDHTLERLEERTAG